MNDSKYDTVNEVLAAAQPLLRPVARLLNTLANNCRFDINYNREIAADFEGFGNLSLSNSGDRLQASGITGQPYDILSLTVGVRHGDWELAFVGNNRTDGRGPTFVGTTGPLSGSGPTAHTLGFASVSLPGELSQAAPRPHRALGGLRAVRPFIEAH